MRLMSCVIRSSCVALSLVSLAPHIGCSAEYPEGKIACTSDDDCPSGMRCQANGRCARPDSETTAEPPTPSPDAPDRNSPSLGDAAVEADPPTGSPGGNRGGAGAPPRADSGAADDRDSASGPASSCNANHGGCDPQVACVAVSGVVSCGDCPVGYLDVRGDGTLCEDVDECLAVPSPCGPSALCTNGPGAYACEECPPGFSALGGQCAQSTLLRIGTDLDDTGLSVALGAQGEVVVAGSTSGAFDGMNAGRLDAFVTKLDASGNVLWARQFGGSGDDEAASVALDEEGGVYVAGYTSNDPGFAPLAQVPLAQRAFVAKFDPTGERVWMHELETGPSRATALVVDADGGGTMAGETTNWDEQGPRDRDLLMVRFGSDGTFQSIRATGTGDDDWAASLVRGSSSLYVAGATTGSMDEAENAGGVDMLVMKIDQDFYEPIWSAQLGSFAHDEGTRVGVDAEWNAYVVGSVSGPIEDTDAAGEEDVLLARFERDGEQVWVQRIGTPQSDVGYDVVAGADDMLYVAGVTYGSLAADNRGGADAFVAKYDLDGSEQWSRQLGGEADDSVRAAALDREGVLWLLVNSASTWDGVASSGGTDIYLFRFDAEGRQL
jgi:Beta-propeller repeat/Calcium-binding EGF domain